MAKGVKTYPPRGWRIPTGICECGCGKKTELVKNSRPKFDQYAGHYQRFIHGHNRKGHKPANFKGVKIHQSGHIKVFKPDHPNCDMHGYVLEHRLVYEQTHGVLLPRHLHIHHIDGDPQNNDPSNLVAVTNKQHREIHRNMEQTTKKLSDAQYKRYSDPAERKKHSERMKRWWAERLS